MRKVLRFVLLCLFMLLFWPVFMYKQYGNAKYKLENRTIIIANHYSTWDALFIYLMYGWRKKYIL